jgi:hypothetical protein
VKGFGLPDAVKDEDAAHPVAAAWRPILCAIVRAFVRGDYRLNEPVAGVEPIPEDLAEHIRASIADYGATLIELPTDTWETSCAQWMGGHWDVLVDLWTEEEGPSDLVLQVEVNESDAGPRFAVQLVYVP